MKQMLGHATPHILAPTVCGCCCAMPTQTCCTQCALYSSPAAPSHLCSCAPLRALVQHSACYVGKLAGAIRCCYHAALGSAHTQCMPHTVYALLISSCLLRTVHPMHMLAMLALLPLGRVLLLATGACMLAGHNMVLCCRASAG